LQKKRFVCNECGKVVKEADSFCGGCGVRLTEETRTCETYEDGMVEEEAQEEEYFETNEAENDRFEAYKMKAATYKDKLDGYIDKGTKISRRAITSFTDAVKETRNEKGTNSGSKYDAYDRIVEKGETDMDSLTASELLIYMNHKGYTRLVSFCTTLNILDLIIQIPGTAIISKLFGNAGMSLVLLCNILVIAEIVVAMLGRNRAHLMRVIYGLSIVACLFCSNIIGLIVNIIIFVSFGKYTATSI